MASLLYSLSQIWPLNSSKETASPTTKLSEAELKSLNKGTFQIPSEKLLSRSIANIPRTQACYQLRVTAANNNESQQLHASASSEIAATSLPASSKKRFVKARTFASNGNTSRCNDQLKRPVLASCMSNQVCRVGNQFEIENPETYNTIIEQSEQEQNDEECLSDIFNNNTCDSSADQLQLAQSPGEEKRKDTNSIIKSSNPTYQTMWEDSGYESPMLNTCTQQFSEQSDETTLTSHQRTQTPTIKASRTDQKSDSSNITQAVLQFVRNQKPQASCEEKKDLKGFLNDSSASIEGEMFPTFTSTPIKRNLGLRNTQTVNAVTISTNPFGAQQSLGETQDTRIGRSFGNSSGGSGTPGEYSFENQPLGKDFRSRSVDPILGAFDEDKHISKVVQESSEEFHGKYSGWIAQIFDLQLEKLQRRLQTQFDRKLDLMTKEKDREILAMQQKFRNKLTEFESSTEKFQKWVDSLNEENQRLRETSDTVVEEMQKTVKEQNESFSLEIEKQINNVQAECEKEKLSMQKRHADQLKFVTDKLVGQMTKMEEQQQRQVESLQKVVSDLKAQNETLEGQLSFLSKGRKSSRTQMDMMGPNNSSEADEQLLINELREKLSISEKEKAGLIAAHNAELIKAQVETDKLVQTLSNRLTSTVDNDLIKKYEEENHLLKKKIMVQELQYKRTLDDLRARYGSRIEQLTNTVEALQKNLKQE